MQHLFISLQHVQVSACDLSEMILPLVLRANSNVVFACRMLFLILRPCLLCYVLVPGMLAIHLLYLDSFVIVVLIIFVSKSVQQL